MKLINIWRNQGRKKAAACNSTHWWSLFHKIRPHAKTINFATSWTNLCRDRPHVGNNHHQRDRIIWTPLHSPTAPTATWHTLNKHGGQGGGEGIMMLTWRHSMHRFQRLVTCQAACLSKDVLHVLKVFFKRRNSTPLPLNWTCQCHNMPRIATNAAQDAPSFCSVLPDLATKTPSEIFSEKDALTSETVNTTIPDFAVIDYFNS